MGKFFFVILISSRWTGRISFNRTLWCPMDNSKFRSSRKIMSQCRTLWTSNRTFFSVCANDKQRSFLFLYLYGNRVNRNSFGDQWISRKKTRKIFLDPPYSFRSCIYFRFIDLWNFLNYNQWSHEISRKICSNIWNVSFSVFIFSFRSNTLSYPLISRN